MSDPQDERPEVCITALTANTIEVMIELAQGTVRLVCGHDLIEVEARGTNIKVKP